MKEYTDNEIIECLRSRQGEVVPYLADRYLPMVRLMVTQLGGAPEDVKDIFQEGLMVMLEKIDDKRFALTCKFKTLFFCVCENLWKCVLTRRHSAANYFTRRVEPEEEKDLSEVIDYKSSREIMKGVLETIDPLGKSILMLYWEEMSPQQIADILGYSYGYVKKKKCEAQAELIEKVKKHPDYQKIMKSGIVAEKVVF
ncbi:MAG: sigma-70 family RNA polymerase sigma factor [Bacteroidales bacterium]